MPEIVLHYIWEHCLWAGYDQQTTDGRKVEIIAVGEHNRDAGPDYSHAHVRIDGKEWVGNIEIHVSASDWLRHRHHLDSAYDNVILHVVRTADKPVYNSKGELVPQCELQYPSDRDYLTSIFQSAQQMDSAFTRIGCAEQLVRDPAILTDGWRRTLLRKRFECKRDSINRLLEITKRELGARAVYIVSPQFRVPHQQPALRAVSHQYPPILLAETPQQPVSTHSIANGTSRVDYAG